MNKRPISKKAKKPETKLAKVKRSFNDRHPFVVPLITLGVLFFGSVIGFFLFGGKTLQPIDTKVINFHLEGKDQTIITRAKTVGEFLQRSNIKVAEGDIVEPNAETEIDSAQFTINLYKARTVIITDTKGKTTTTKTADTIPEVVAKKAGYNLYPEDKVKILEPDQSLKQGVISAQINIDRATFVKLNLFGTNYDVRTHATTVAGLAKERSINFSDKSILPSPETRLKDNDIVFITELGKQLGSDEQAIPRGTETVVDNNLESGKTEVRSQGSDGKKAVVFEVLPGGARKILQEVIIAQPVNKVVAKGRKIPALPSNINVSADKVALMSAAGIGASDFTAADFIVSHESGWRPGAGNASSGAYGLCQALPASKMASAGGDYLTNPVTQLAWCNGYASRTYGGWGGAYNFWVSHRWW